MKSTAALVFGYNGEEKPGQPRLLKAESDAAAVCSLLSELGFYLPAEAAGIGENATTEQLEAGARKIAEHRPVGLVFYFAGHGRLYGGRNAIEFADGLGTLEEIKDQVLHHLQDVRRLVMVVDACRVVSGTPQAGNRFSPGGAKRSEESSRGFAEKGMPGPPGKGRRVEMAYLLGCEWGQASIERVALPHGYFTGALISEIRQSATGDPLGIKDLAARLRMEDGQRATAMDEHGLGLRTLSGVEATAPEHSFAGSIETLACSETKTLCLTSRGELAVSDRGRNWAVLPLRFDSAGLNDISMFAHAVRDLVVKYENVQRPPRGMKHDVARVALSAGGTWLAAVPACANERVHLYQASDPTVEHPLPISGIRYLQFIDDDAEMLLIDREGNLAVYNWRRGSSLPLQIGSAPVCPARTAVSPDGAWIAWSNWNGGIFLWRYEKDVFSYQQKDVEQAPQLVAAATALTFGRTGMFAAGLANGSVLVRQASASGMAFMELMQWRVQGIVTALAFTKEDRHLMIGTSRGAVHAVEMRTSKRAKAGQ